MLDFHTLNENLYTDYEKDKLFIKTLNFILNFLKEESPDIIINLHIPHNYFEVLLAELKKGCCQNFSRKLVSHHQISQDLFVPQDLWG